MSDPFKVSHSKVKTWRSCRKQYHYKYVRKLRRKVKARALQFGSFVHEAIEEYQKNGKFKETVKRFNKEIGKVFEEERIEFGLDRLVEEGTTVVLGYVDLYKNDGLKYRAVELEINVPLADGVVFTGKVDAIVEDASGDLWLFERKTCKKIPEEDIRLTDIQTVLYFWATENLKIKSGNRVFRLGNIRGIIWDYVRSKAPSIPGLNKNGEMSRAAVDTTWEVYRAELVKAGLDPDDYEDMRERLAGKEDSFFRRIKLPFSKTMRDMVLDDFRSTSIEMKALHEVSQDRNLGWGCQHCEFKNLCIAELRGADTELMLKKDYEVRKDEKESEEQERRRDS
jgi:hypothetical protein